MNRWIIECRDAEGRLDFTGPQPHEVFGEGAIRGMTDHAIAVVVYRRCPDVSLSGDSIATWPSHIDPRWRARGKYW